MLTPLRLLLESLGKLLGCLAPLLYALESEQGEDGLSVDQDILALQQQGLIKLIGLLVFLLGKGDVAGPRRGVGRQFAGGKLLADLAEEPKSLVFLPQPQFQYRLGEVNAI